MTAADYQQRREEANRLYERYGKPLEEDHQGSYLAISPSGKTILGKTLGEVVAKAKSAFGQGNFIFKVGARSVGSFR